MVNSIRIDRDVPMKMRDGVILRADICRPDDNDKHPAIVSRSPYNKLMSYASDFMSPVSAAFAGYAFVAQDIRGRFASEGSWLPGSSEGPDSYDTIENIAAEKWCDGNVGMSGGSYLGQIQWLTAIENPPHLKAIAPDIVGSGLVFDFRLAGPIDFEMGISWFVGQAINVIERMKQAGKDVSKSQEMLERARFNIAEVYNYLPVNDIPHFKYPGLEGGFRRLSDTLPPEIKTDEDLFWSYQKAKVPCSYATGWFDIATGGIFHNFLNMRENGGSQIAREGQYIICGPWVHGARLPMSIGAVHFGPSSSGVASFFTERRIAFYDKYLRGIESRISNPPVRYFVMGLNQWRNADTWPLLQTEWQRFFLHSEGHAHTAAGNGMLTRDIPTSEPTDMFIFDPKFPTPTVGGRLLDTGSMVPGPQ
jgi:putative CocE/NonD family hydrolase